jgi:hypothetical protein
MYPDACCLSDTVGWVAILCVENNFDNPDARHFCLAAIDADRHNALWFSEDEIQLFRQYLKKESVAW